MNEEQKCFDCGSSNIDGRCCRNCGIIQPLTTSEGDSPDASTEEQYQGDPVDESVTPAPGNAITISASHYHHIQSEKLRLTEENARLLAIQEELVTQLNECSNELGVWAKHDVTKAIFRRSIELAHKYRKGHDFLAKAGKVG